MDFWVDSFLLVFLKEKSGKKKEHKPKLLGPDVFRWGGGLPREGVGAKKFGVPLETLGNQPFGRDIPRFWLGYPGGARKVETKQVCLCSIFEPLKEAQKIHHKIPRKIHSPGN